VRVSDHPEINGILELPPNPIGIVVFAHGGDSGRFSPRNNYVARVLQQVQLGTQQKYLKMFSPLFLVAEDQI
jgi:putative phosphoribosyl transferase